MQQIQVIELISVDPQVRSGRPCIAGTTITVASVFITKVLHGQAPEEIAADYDLSLGQVYAALAYYYENKDEIDGDIAERRKLAIQMKDKGVGSRYKPLSR